jgi:P-type Ca2+ transporter type 2C
MKDIEQRKSPLQVKMDELGKKLSIVSFAIIACIMAIGIFQGKSFLSMFNIGKGLEVTDTIRYDTI